MMPSVHRGVLHTHLPLYCRRVDGVRLIFVGHSEVLLIAPWGIASGDSDGFPIPRVLLTCVPCQCHGPHLVWKVVVLGVGVQVTCTAVLVCCVEGLDSGEFEVSPLYCSYVLSEHVGALLSRHDELTCSEVDVVIDHIPQPCGVMDGLSVVLLDDLVEPIDHHG